MPEHLRGLLVSRQLAVDPPHGIMLEDSDVPLVLLLELSSLPLGLAATARHFLDFQEMVAGAVEDLGRGVVRPLSDAAQEAGSFAEALFPWPAFCAARIDLGLS